MFFARGPLSRLAGDTAGLLVAGSAAAQSSRSPITNQPAVFGITEYTVTYVSA